MRDRVSRCTTGRDDSEMGHREAEKRAAPGKKITAEAKQFWAIRQGRVLKRGLADMQRWDDYDDLFCMDSARKDTSSSNSA
jgi:hypothetical protein